MKNRNISESKYELMQVSNYLIAVLNKFVLIL